MNDTLYQNSKLYTPFLIVFMPKTHLEESSTRENVG